MGIRVYSKVNIKYVNPLAYDYITKIAFYFKNKHTHTHTHKSMGFVEIFTH